MGIRRKRKLILRGCGNCVYLRSEMVHDSMSRLKRETGENPVQTRCCESRHTVPVAAAVKRHATATRREGRATEGTSQKTCHSRALIFQPRLSGHKAAAVCILNRMA